MAGSFNASPGVLSSLPNTFGTPGSSSSDLLSLLFGSGAGNTGIIGSLGDLTQAGLGAYLQDILFGQLQNIYGNSQNVYNLQTTAAQNAQNPAYLNSAIQQLSGPLFSSVMGKVANQTPQLSKQLVSSVWNSEAPTLAGAGLSTSPGMATGILGNALAPYQMQEQQLAANTALGTLGLGNSDITGGLSAPFGIGSALAGYIPNTGSFAGTGGFDAGSLLSGLGQSLAPLFTGSSTP